MNKKNQFIDCPSYILSAGILIRETLGRTQALRADTHSFNKKLMYPMKNIFALLLLILHASCLGQSPESKLQKLGIELTDIQPTSGNYVNAVRTGSIVYLSGRGPLETDGNYTVGKLGKDLTVQQGYNAARLAAIQQISVLKVFLGSLDKVIRIVKVSGYINSSEDFSEHSKVMNGCSDLMVVVFGEKGKHARSAVGMSSLPGNWAVEVEIVVE